MMERGIVTVAVGRIDRNRRADGCVFGSWDVYLRSDVRYFGGKVAGLRNCFEGSVYLPASCLCRRKRGYLVGGNPSQNSAHCPLPSAHRFRGWESRTDSAQLKITRSKWDVYESRLQSLVGRWLGDEMGLNTKRT